MVETLIVPETRGSESVAASAAVKIDVNLLICEAVDSGKPTLKLPAGKRRNVNFDFRADTLIVDLRYDIFEINGRGTAPNGNTCCQLDARNGAWFVRDGATTDTSTGHGLRHRHHLFRFPECECRHLQVELQYLQRPHHRFRQRDQFPRRRHEHRRYTVA